MADPGVDRQLCYRCRSTDIYSYGSKNFLCRVCGLAWVKGVTQAEFRIARQREQESGKWRSLDWRNLPGG